jgi:hypothetical protein
MRRSSYLMSVVWLLLFKRRPCSLRLAYQDSDVVFSNHSADFVARIRFAMEHAHYWLQDGLIVMKRRVPIRRTILEP